MIEIFQAKRERESLDLLLTLAITLFHPLNTVCARERGREREREREREEERESDIDREVREENYGSDDREG